MAGIPAQVLILLDSFSLVGWLVAGALRRANQEAMTAALCSWELFGAC